MYGSSWQTRGLHFHLRRQLNTPPTHPPTPCAAEMAALDQSLRSTRLHTSLPSRPGRPRAAYITPCLAIAAMIQSTMSFETDHDRFIYTMRIFQVPFVAPSVGTARAGSL